ncbi:MULTISPECIES: hypothetical protein [unclassified Pantoea]|uniref:hypothetical protein n=1 Tax=unclassified Pantoea TaxID=2630326 RepID=UPI0012326855|nr:MULTISPECIES: hypothetical protein [unclassified Pantoea]KAA6097098.1 hypothetical protein F3I21_17680 [Pantoea sp. B_9]KAA6110456.1 hypothetical protein F3I18_17890 [Pantoea sp. B_10]
MMLAIFSLTEKQTVMPEEFGDRLPAITMLMRKGHDTIVDVKLARSDKSRWDRARQIAESRAFWRSVEKQFR